MRGYDKVKNPLRKLAGLLKVALFAVFMTILTGCAAPARIPQFAEQQIAGPGVYSNPQWSSDNHYLAFMMDESRNPTLTVYDTNRKTTWSVVSNIASRPFGWAPNNDLTYLKDSPPLSGSPFPIISDLHQIDLMGGNDRIIAAHLSNVEDFAWFKDGERIAILHGGPSNNTFQILNSRTGTTELLVEAQDIGLQYLVMFALSPDEKIILIKGLHEEDGSSEGQIILYSLETKIILDRIIPKEIIPSGNTTYPPPAMGDAINAAWVGGTRWFLASVITPGGECYNYALFFFDTHNLQNSICLPTVGGIIDYPTISPDLQKISYVTVVGPGKSYLMVGNVTSDLLGRLELNGQQ